MRKNIVAGNWKMNTTLQEGLQLAEEVNKLVKNNSIGEVKIILSPSFIHLSEVSKIVDKNKIDIAAQNCASEVNGAFTGEVSAKMIKSAGINLVIIGHSERRSIYNEDNQTLNKKVKLAIENDLHPIFCVGELLEDRNSGNYFNIIKSQLEEGVFNLSADDFKKLIIAYEPVWAIGTGAVATPEQAQEIHHFIRELIAEKYGQVIANNTSILYGGSCKPSNAKELFSNPDVDGGLIGGAALDAKDFVDIIKSF